MRKLVFFAVASLAVLVSADVLASVENLGALQFARADNGVYFAKGIPYAEPPVGTLRWQEPIDRSFTERAWSASEFGASCMSDLIDPPASSEDCLTLNVWTPSVASKRPVMVWIHGGAFRWGDGNVPGERLAEEGVVVVSLNYRLGPLGFFADPNSDGGVANFGLLDILSALRWVQRHIGEFGGDPEKVTIFGISAGAMAVNLLIANPRAKGLFKRAIAQSGWATWPLWYRRDQLAKAPLFWAGGNVKVAEKQTAQLLRRAGLSGDESLAQLRAIEPMRLIDAQSGFQMAIVDGLSIVSEPGMCFEDRRCRVNGDAYLSGASSFEGSIMPWTGIKQDQFQSWFVDQARSIEATYPHDFSESRELGYRRFFGDLRYLTSAEISARALHRRGLAVYTYFFDAEIQLQGDRLLGAPHGADSIIFWGDSDKYVGFEALGAQLRRAWVRFATGQSIAVDRTWRPWRADQPYWQLLGARSGDATQSLAPRLELIRALYKQRKRTSQCVDDLMPDCE